MNDILFGNNNSEVITKLSKRYFKKNKVRNLAALLAIILTAFLFTSITSLAFNMASSIQLSLQMQKGSKADGTLGYMTEEQYEQLVNSDFVEQAGHRRIIGYASNTSSHSIEINYADSVQQELTFCVPTHGAAPEKANEIATTDLALKALGVEPKIGAAVPLEFELRGKTYHYDMVLSGWCSLHRCSSADPEYNRCPVCVPVQSFCAALRHLLCGADSSEAGPVLRCLLWSDG